MSIRSILGAFGKLNFVVSRDEVEQCDIYSVLKALNRLCATSDTARNFKGRVEMAFFGYDSDEREVYQIPEIRRFVAMLDREWPYWFYFVSTDSTLLNTIAFCLCRVTVVRPEWVVPNQLDMVQFMMRHFQAMDQLFEKFSWDVRENHEIVDDIGRYFSS